MDLFISYYPLYTSHALFVPLFPSQILTPIPRATTRHTPELSLSSIGFNFIFEANFKVFSGFFTLFRLKIALILHLNAEIEREIIGERWKFERELTLGIVRGIGNLGWIYL